MKTIKPINSCNLCELCYNRKPVNGIGNINAEIMIIINKPNYYTVKNDNIFESEVGNILTKLFKMINIDIKDNVYITHLVKGRSLTLKSKNVLACSNYLRNEIKEVNPKIIISMGYLPTKFILKDKKPLYNHIGKAYKTKQDSYIIPMYDINYVMRDIKLHGLAVRDFTNLYKLYKHFINPNIATFESKLHPAIKTMLNK